MKKCPHYLEYTWGEPPLEPNGEGQRYKEFECKLAKHYFIAAECEGDITKCNLPDQLYNILKEYRVKEKELETELKLYKTPDNILVKEYQKQQEKIEKLEKNNQHLDKELHEAKKFCAAILIPMQNLEAVRDCVEEYRQAKEKLIRNKTEENMENASVKYTKLMQALAAKGK